MATTLNKSKLLTQILSSAPKASKTEPDTRPVLEQFIYAICRADTTRENADTIFDNLRQRFYDWNEIRVSSSFEVGEAMDRLVPDAERRGQRIIDFLQEVFEKTYSFDLETMHKKGVKQAAKSMSGFATADEFIVALVVQQSLGGHALPLDANALRLLTRTGILEEGGDLETLRGSLEHQIPKTKGVNFLDAISELTANYCTENDPACPDCPLRNNCAMGSTMKATASAGKKSR